MRGKPAPKGTSLQNGNVSIQITNNNHYETRPEVLNVYGDASIRRALDGVVKPLRNPGIDHFEVKKNNETIESIDRTEIPYAAIPVAPDVQSEAQPPARTLHEGEHTVSYPIVKLSFVEKHKWTLGEGKEKFNAKIEDKEFW